MFDYEKAVWSHFYNAQRQPVVTVCYLDTVDGTAIGISVCSPSDRPAKKIGRGISFERARFAAVNHGGDGSICWSCSAVERLEAMRVLRESDIDFYTTTRLASGTGVYKISYVDEPGFRYKRQKQGNSQTPLLSLETNMVETD